MSPNLGEFPEVLWKGYSFSYVAGILLRVFCFWKPSKGFELISLICMTHPNPIHSKLVTGVRRTCEPYNKVPNFRNQEFGICFDNSPILWDYCNRV